LGLVFQARGDGLAAMEAYARATAPGADPAVAAQAHRRRGEALANAGRWDEARDELARAVTLAPAEGGYHLDYGWYLYQAGDSLAQARGELEKAVALLPDNPWPSLRLAHIAFYQDDYARALAHAEQAITANERQVWGWIWKGWALRRLDRRAEAEAALRQATQVDPENAQAHASLGSILGQRGQRAEAIVEYERAVALAPANVGFHLNLANVYRADGQVAKASAAYRRVLQLDPNNESAREALREIGE
jgi:tetratricopeptide (TPR) repeat protein